MPTNTDVQNNYKQLMEKNQDTKLQQIDKEIQELLDDNKNNDGIDVNQIIDDSFNIDKTDIYIILNYINNLLDENSDLGSDLNDLKNYLEQQINTADEEDQNDNPTSEEIITLNSNEKEQLRIANTTIKRIESLQGNNNQNNRTTIDNLKKIINNPNTINKNQLVTFLQNNGISDINENTTNIELLQGINLILRNINLGITNIDSQNKINLFFDTIINGKREDLDQFDNKELLQNIKSFVEQNPRNNTIIEAYLKMKGSNIAEQNNINGQDKKVFEEIFTLLEQKYGEGGNGHEILQQKLILQQYKLDKQFDTRRQTNGNRLLIALCEEYRIGNKEHWEGEQINNNTNNVNSLCTQLGFNVDQFVTKFNFLNEKRIKNNKDNLKSFPILTVLGEELNNIHIIDGQLKYKQGNNYNDLNTDTIVNLLNLEDKAKQQLQTDPGKTNFASENELIAMINNNTDIREKRLNTIRTRVIEQNGNQEIEMTFDNLPNLDANSIKKVFSNLDKQDIVNFFNEQKVKTNLTEPQKAQLVLLYEGLTKRFVDPNNNNINLGKQKIETLQDYLKENDKNLVTDGKFGINTFNALRNSFDVPQLTSRPQAIKVEKRSENIPEGWEYQETFNNGTKLYRITNIKYLIDPNSFPENSCVKYNGITFHRSGDCYNENIGTNHDIGNDGNGTRYKMGNSGILIHYEEFNQIQYISDNQKFTEKYDYDKIKNNYNLFIEILKTLKSDSNNCYSFDGNNIISNNTKSPRYYEKEGKLIKIDKSNSTTENHYYIRNGDQFVDMGNLISHANYSSSYEILNQYKKYV